MSGARGTTGVGAAARPAARDNRFFLPASFVLLALTVWGFGPTFFFTIVAPSPHPSILTRTSGLLRAVFLLHGLVFTAWMLLYVAQTGLVAARHVVLHRRLGQAAAVLIPLVVVLGLTAGVESLRFRLPEGGDRELAFFAVPLIAALDFGGFAWLGYLRRRDPAAHKRYMLMASMALVGAAVARIDALSAVFPSWFDVVALLLPALLCWDFFSLRRAHPVTLWGGLVFLVLDFGMGPLGRTGAWLAMMHHLVG